MCSYGDLGDAALVPSLCKGCEHTRPSEDRSNLAGPVVLWIDGSVCGSYGSIVGTEYRAVRTPELAEPIRCRQRAHPSQMTVRAQQLQQKRNRSSATEQAKPAQAHAKNLGKNEARWVWPQNKGGSRQKTRENGGKTEGKEVGLQGCRLRHRRVRCPDRCKSHQQSCACQK